VFTFLHVMIERLGESFGGAEPILLGPTAETMED
jgi:hypothetical protein